MANIDDGFSVETLSLDDLVLIKSHVDDPTIGAGYEAPIGSILLRTNGIVYRKIGTADVDWKPIDGINIADVLSDMQDPTGYPTRADSQISFVDATRTFTVAPLLPATSFSYYIFGVKYTVTSAQSVAISDTTGMHFVYFDNTGTLNATDTFDISLLTTKGYTAAIYWNRDAGKAVYVADERHGMRMDGSTHIHLHESLGTQFISGLALGDIIADGSGDINTTAQLSVAPGIIRDEDVEHQIVDTGFATNTYDLTQDLSPLGRIPVLYRLGASATWHIKPADDFPLIYNGTAGWTGVRPPYNQFIGGAWQLTEVTNNDFVLVHILATNDIYHPIIALLGTTDYPTKPSSREAVMAELGTYSGLPFQEFVPIGSLIFEIKTIYTNTPKARIRLTDSGDNYIDWRSLDTFSSTIGGGGITDHGNLSGLLDDDHPQYALAGTGSTRTFQLDDLSNVTVALPLDTQGLVYTGGIWSNQNLVSQAEVDNIEASLGDSVSANGLWVGFTGTTYLNGATSTTDALTILDGQIITASADSIVSRHNGGVTQTFNTTPTTLLFSTSTRTDANYTYDAGTITILTAGSYIISFDASYTSTSNNVTTAQTSIYKNGAVVIGSIAHSNHSSLTSGQQTTTCTLNVSCAANDTIRVVGVRVLGTGSLVTQVDGCRLNISKLR